MIALLEKLTKAIQLKNLKNTRFTEKDDVNTADYNVLVDKINETIIEIEEVSTEVEAVANDLSNLDFPDPINYKRIVYVDATYGNNTLAVANPYSIQYPHATVASARSLMSPGDKMVILSGSHYYNNQVNPNLWLDGSSIEVTSGASLAWKPLQAMVGGYGNDLLTFEIFGKGKFTLDFSFDNSTVNLAKHFIVKTSIFELADLGFSFCLNGSSPKFTVDVDYMYARIYPNTVCLTYCNGGSPRYDIKAKKSELTTNTPYPGNASGFCLFNMNPSVAQYSVMDFGECSLQNGRLIQNLSGNANNYFLIKGEITHKYTNLLGTPEWTQYTLVFSGGIIDVQANITNKRGVCVYTSGTTKTTILNSRLNSDTDVTSPYPDNTTLYVDAGSNTIVKNSTIYSKAVNGAVIVRTTAKLSLSEAFIKNTSTNIAASAIKVLSPLTGVISVRNAILLVNPANLNSNSAKSIDSPIITTTSGTLVIGKTYNIATVLGSDNFSNVGFVTPGVDFVATDVTPLLWTSLTVVTNITDSNNVGRLQVLGSLTANGNVDSLITDTLGLNYVQVSNAIIDTE